MDRRTYLGLVGAAATVAGCSSDGAGTRDTTRDDTSSDDRDDTSSEPDDQPSGTPETTERPRSPIHADYETTAVRAVSAAGESLGSVTAAIADTPQLRYTGLSDTDRLPADRGMLFVYGSVADRTFVMRRMDFGIDIVYADSDRRITAIHHAPEPGPDEDGDAQRYPGRGQYVLEVPYEWTTEHGVSEGDSLEFALPA